MLGSGDDCAVLQPPAGQQLAVSTDTLIAGRHFPLDTSAHAVGYKSLAVSLSDLAAMGAAPAWASLAISLPEPDAAWLQGFAGGFAELAAQYAVQLIGGDTTRGALSITVTVVGFVPPGEALRRSGAQAGDAIYVSGQLGAAGFELRRAPAGARPHLDYPPPRVALGQALRGCATAAIDISDGLLADLGHILQASGQGADLRLSALPYHPLLGNADSLDEGSLPLALCAGDEYELCFTAAPAQAAALAALAEGLQLPLSNIGTVRDGHGLSLYRDNGELYDLSQLRTAGYNHFAE